MGLGYIAYLWRSSAGIGTQTGRHRHTRTGGGGWHRIKLVARRRKRKAISQRVADNVDCGSRTDRKCPTLTKPGCAPVAWRECFVKHMLLSNTTGGFFLMSSVAYRWRDPIILWHRKLCKTAETKEKGKGSQKHGK